VQLITNFQTYFHRSFTSHNLASPISKMSHPELPYDRRFHVDRTTAQTFFQERVNGDWTTWRPLEPSDFHPPHPAAHNVGVLMSLCPIPSANPSVCLQVLSHIPPPPDPTVTFDPSLRQLDPPPSTQPSMRISGREVGQGRTSASPPPPSQSQRNVRQARRNDRAYDPIRTERSQSRRGRTRGAPNYRPREVEVLLDLVDEELPVGAKGWNVVGARFREWAANTEHPARADRSLEIKYKQVRCHSSFIYPSLIIDITSS
jgi:hypothetical protein